MTTGAMDDDGVCRGNMQRHRHQEFNRFLNAVEAEVPKAKAIHVILDLSSAQASKGASSWAATSGLP
jgi:hypothetical protein